MIDKTIYLGLIDNKAITIKIQYAGGFLTITGSCENIVKSILGGKPYFGQLIADFEEYDPRGIYSICKIYHSSYSKDKIRTLFDIWDVYHANGQVTSCQHQRDLRWDSKKIDHSKPVQLYGIHYDGQKRESWNLWGWIPEEDHPNGLLNKPCPICGHKYGSARQVKEIPDYVVKYLENF